VSGAIKQRITETLESNYMPYAMSVIVSRAIPEIDGFKPSHRKLLYTMYKMKLLSGTRTKSANVVGQTMKLNPHGDQAIYATLVRLSRGYDALIHPYIDSKGNFGKSSSRDMKYAASRYTEVKLDGICYEIFKDIEKNSVEFVDNYDGKMKEPTLLPTTFPNVLVSANRGIAVGMASNICSFNLEEICNTVVEYIKNPECDLMKTISAPDLSTGGLIIYDEKAFKNIYDKGLGSFKLRAKYSYNKDAKCIEITEIPYTTTIEAIIEKIIDLVKNGKVKELSDVRDETDLSGLKIAIDIKRGVDPDVLMAKLFKFTPLEDTFSCNFNILIDGKPQVLGVKGLIKEWLRFRVKCIRNQFNYDLLKLSEKLNLLYGLEKVLLDIDKTISIIRDAEKDSDVIPTLMMNFIINEAQAEFVADIKLRNLNKEYVINKVSEINKLEAEIKRLNKIIENDKEIEKVIIKEQKNIIKKYKRERRTEIIYSDNIIKHDDVVKIEDFKLTLFVTNHDYIKKVSLASLRASNKHKLKDDDSIIKELNGRNIDDVLVFTSYGNVHKIKVSDIPDHKASSLGSYMPNLIELEDGEEIKFVLNTNDYKGHMIFCFENGKVAKVPMSSYITKTNRKKLVKAYSVVSPLRLVEHINEDKDIVMIRKAGSDDYCIQVVNTSLMPEKTTKSSVGVQVARLKKKSAIVKVELIVEHTEFLESARISKIPMSGKRIDTQKLFDMYKIDQ
jgi:DNA gyrase subunit A